MSKFAAVPDSSDHVMAADSQLCGRSLNAVEVGESGASGAPATSAAVKGNGFLYPWPCFSRGPKSWSGWVSKRFLSIARSCGHETLGKCR